MLYLVGILEHLITLSILGEDIHASLLQHTMLLIEFLSSICGLSIVMVLPINKWPSSGESESSI